MSLQLLYLFVIAAQCMLPSCSGILTVPVQIKNGTAVGVCPSEAQLAEARRLLIEDMFLALKPGTTEVNPVSSCSVLPASSPSGYYWIQPATSLPAMQMFCDSTEDNPASSCSALPTNSPSGFYRIQPAAGQPAVQMYCDFNRQCGCDGASTWTRVAFLNTSDPNHDCPNNWTEIEQPVRTCARKMHESKSSCDSTFYRTHQLTYNRVCGRIIAYHEGSTEAFDQLIKGTTIDSFYLDGVSITHGPDGSARSRQHIWSFASARGEHSDISSSFLCDCSNGAIWPYSTAFVGNDYFCDTGNYNTPGIISSIFYSDDPLWDGAGCGLSSTCCSFNNPPWFCKTLPESTKDDLEVRICFNFKPEDTPIQLLELYIQ